MNHISLDIRSKQKPEGPATDPIVSSRKSGQITRLQKTLLFDGKTFTKDEKKLLRAFLLYRKIASDRAGFDLLNKANLGWLSGYFNPRFQYEEGRRMVSDSKTVNSEQGILPKAAERLRWAIILAENTPGYDKSLTRSKDIAPLIEIVDGATSLLKEINGSAKPK